MIKTRPQFALAAALASAFVVPSSAVSAVVFSGDYLVDSSGQPLPDGALVQLVVSTRDGTFARPTADSFTGGGDDRVLGSTVVDSFGGIFNEGLFTGVADFAFDAQVDAGDRLLIRWWPSLTLDALVPGDGVGYGEFRPAEDTTITVGSDSPFVIPESEEDEIVLSVLLEADGTAGNPGGELDAAQFDYGAADGVTTEFATVIVEDDLVVLFTSVVGVAYRVEKSGDLIEWSVLEQDIFGNGEPVQVIDADAVRNSGRSYYRVVTITP